MKVVATSPWRYHTDPHSAGLEKYEHFAYILKVLNVEFRKSNKFSTTKILKVLALFF
jgi:hypothetical protein